jgi:hypothetical protein
MRTMFSAADQQAFVCANAPAAHSDNRRLDDVDTYYGEAGADRDS